jgi:aminoglycoside phosphotransferase family enzyme
MRHSKREGGCCWNMWTPTLEEKVAFLRDPRSYDASVQQVDVRETHMSWVFLTDSVVFKLKKPVRFPYLDFTTLEKRRNACRAEVGLNRRLAADVYLDAVPLSVSPAGLVIGEGVTVVDWLVKMRRLNQGRMLDCLIAEKRLERECIEELALKLADFYRNAHRVFMRPDVFLRHWEYDLRQNRVVLLSPRFKLSPGPVRRLDSLLREFLSQRQALFVDRLKRRRIVDGHGDLRPEHIWLGDEVKIIDCLEFNARLRILDPLEEIACLDLECEHLGMKGIGDITQPCVMQALRDHAPVSLFCFYRCYRAMLRARLSIAHLLAPHPRSPEKWRPQALSYLKLAATDARRLEACLRRPEDRNAACPRASGGWFPPGAARTIRW